MKKSFLLVFVSLACLLNGGNLLLAQISYSCCNTGTNNLLCQVVKGEHLFNYKFPDINNVYYYDYDHDYMPHKREFDTTYMYDEGPDKNPTMLTKSEENVSVAGIESMIKLLQQHQQISNISYYGVRMYYGMEGHKMVILFEPVIFDQISLNVLKKITYPSKQFYKFRDDGSFIVSNYSGIKNYIEEYRSPSSKIWIRHKDWSSPQLQSNHKFYLNNDQMHLKDNDIKSSIMPLQQIIRMYLDNGGDCNDTSTTIKFSFVTNNLCSGNEDRNHDAQIKPHIIASYNFNSASSRAAITLKRSGLVRQFGSLSYYKKNKKAAQPAYITNSFADGLAADYSEACPTSCNNETQQ